MARVQRPGASTLIRPAGDTCREGWYPVLMGERLACLYWTGKAWEVPRLARRAARLPKGSRAAGASSGPMTATRGRAEENRVFMADTHEIDGEMNMFYLKRIPETVPLDSVIVHNHVRPTRRLGSRGFRAWLAPSLAAETSYERCDCGWAPELAIHYRVKPRVV
jgi:hypothetical protein